MAEYQPQQKDALSMNRFKGRDIEALDDAEYCDYVLAALLQGVIQRLEGSINNDRIFHRTKFDVMASTWDARSLLRKRLFGEG